MERQAGGKEEGVKVEILMEIIKDNFRQLSLQQKHEIRQRIFESNIMKNTKYLSRETRAIHNHTSYQFLDDLQAAILLTCTTYHSIHVRYLAQQISGRGQFECKQCGTKCSDMKDIELDALLHAFYQKIHNYPGSILIFKKREIGQLMQAQVQRQAEQTQSKTVIVQSNHSTNKVMLVEVKILQLVRDQSLQNLQIERLFMNLEKAKGVESRQFKRKYLDNSTAPILTNTICFSSFVRIRNPLIHKHCIPSTHDNKLVVYSYQNIYHQIFSGESKENKVRCKFPGCQNYFDKQNFEQHGIVVEQLQHGYYDQNRQNFTGMYFWNGYYKNWQSKMAEEWISSKTTKSGKLNPAELRSRVNQLINTTNLRQGVNKSNKLIKKSITAQNPRLKWIKEKDNLIAVSLGEFNVCPVRCVKCGNLDALDIYLAATLFYERKQKRCPLCRTEVKKKQLYDTYFIDVQLMQFIYLHGFASQIHFNIHQKQYLHKDQHPTGGCAAGKLKAEKRMINWQGISQIYVGLKQGKNYALFIDQKCRVPTTASNLVQHIRLFNVLQELPIPQLKSHGDSQKLGRILLPQQFVEILTSNTQDYEKTNTVGNSTNRRPISSLKQYADIFEQQEIKKAEVCTFYWKNEQGGLIKYPVAFKRCTHSFQTRLCDFADILHQIRTYSRKTFKCRFVGCSNQYQFQDQLVRLKLGINQVLEEDHQLKDRIITTDSYWITYRAQETITVSSKLNPENNEIEQFEQRNKFRCQFNTIYKELSLRQIMTSKSKVQEQIRNLQNFLASPQSNQFDPLQYDNSQLLKIKLALLELLQKQGLLAQRQKQLASEQKVNVKVNNNKRNMLQSIQAKFPNQLKKLARKKQLAIQLPESRVSFEGIQTQGNLFLFEYPVKQQPQNLDTSLLYSKLEKLRREPNMQQGI